MTWNQNKTQIVDSYCSEYHPVIQEKGDGSAVASIPNLNVKRRILANEIVYKDDCK